MVDRRRLWRKYMQRRDERWEAKHLRRCRRCWWPLPIDGHEYRRRRLARGRRS